MQIPSNVKPGISLPAKKTPALPEAENTPSDIDPKTKDKAVSLCIEHLRTFTDAR